MPTRRTYGSYDDGCAAAHALDLVGDRWALIVVRELVLGPKRFADLRSDIPGISPSVLAQRLRELEEVGVVVHDELPPPARVNVYDLTPWGRQLEEVLQALGRWGAQSPRMPHHARVTDDTAILASRTMGATAAEQATRKVTLRLLLRARGAACTRARRVHGGAFARGRCRRDGAFRLRHLDRRAAARAVRRRRGRRRADDGRRRPLGPQRRRRRLPPPHRRTPLTAPGRRALQRLAGTSSRAHGRSWGQATRPPWRAIRGRVPTPHEVPSPIACCRAHSRPVDDGPERAVDPGTMAWCAWGPVWMTSPSPCACWVGW